MATLREQLVELMQSGKVELVATQAQVSFPLIERMYRKMMINVPFRAIQVHEKAVIEGHHRYLASMLAGQKMDQVPTPRSQAKQDVEWKKVQLLEDDYYTAARIKILNEEDAQYLGISVEALLERIK